VLFTLLIQLSTFSPFIYNDPLPRPYRTVRSGG